MAWWRFDRRLAAHFDWVLVVALLAVAAVGVLTVHSATYTARAGVSPLVLRQLAWLGVGLACMGATVVLDYRRLERFAHHIYAASVFLLALVPATGEVSGGAQRWLDLGLVTVQPSELVKIAVVIEMARFFQNRTVVGECRLRELLLPALLVAVPLALVAAQPDLGTVGAFVLLFLSLCLVGGLRLRSLLSLLAAGGSLLPVVWRYLKPYQRQRIVTFLNPNLDPLGAGYHVIQSKIAIGSGMLWGKGFLEGTQNKLHFLPEQHTDFIFSVFAEEWGFVGAMALLALYAFLLARILQAAARAKDVFGSFLCFGVGAIIFWQVVINIGMAGGLLPVVGIPLPLFSYGGSALVTTMIGLGLVLNVSMRRFIF